jgi:hypothetical protein
LRRWAVAHEALPSGAIIVPVGSRVTCNPPPMDTDEDYLVLVKDKRLAIDGLKALGFEYSADPKKVAEYEEMNKSAQWSFTSMWFGDVNYIITESEFFFERFLTATHVCKTLNLLRKEDRVMVFEAVRGGSFFERMLPDWEPSFKGWQKHKKSGSKTSDALTKTLSDNAFANTRIITPMPF